MWTAIFRAVYNEQKNKKIKILPMKKNKLVKNTTWINNPIISQDINYKHNYKFNIDKFKGHGTIKKQNTDYDVYFDDNHIIKNRAKIYKLKNYNLKCEMYFTKEEKEKVDNIVKDLPKKIICIEPHSKNSFTKNKFYPFNKMNNIRNSIDKDITIVQVGVGNKKLLDNVVDLTDSLSFRETCYFLKYCILFIGIEGGLGHCCNVVDTKSFLIIPPLFHPNLIKYPNSECIWLGTEEHKQCGMKKKCNKCHEIINNHNEEIIIKLVNNIIKEL